MQPDKNTSCANMAAVSMNIISCMNQRYDYEHHEKEYTKINNTVKLQSCWGKNWAKWQTFEKTRK